ncbi:hypothetical protein A6J60_001160 [Psychrobacter sp. FDAARGOS_221]|nr:hypothetical protein A6J60_001160 [Psychrobacter sp. FDAARGOS_221]
MDTTSHYDALDTTYHIKAINPSFASDNNKTKAIPSDLYITASTAQYFAHQHDASQTFIKQVYETVHNAKLNYFMPLLFAGTNTNLMSKTAAHIAPKVAIGLKPLYTEKVFLEQYLASPIETVISELVGYDVQRTRICEIGNLASQSAGNARLMIAFLVFYLSTPTQNGTMQTTKADWAVCTGTTAVQHILNHIGIRSHVIAKATSDALADPNQVSAWGRYYQHNPLVLAINVADARTVCSPYFEYTEYNKRNLAPASQLIQASQTIQINQASQPAIIKMRSTHAAHRESLPITHSA